MWEILETPKACRVLDRIPIEIIKKYEKWKDIIRYSGPLALRQMTGLRDEALRGQWFGYRSSRLNLKYRVIYKLEKEKSIILVVDINPHKY